MPPFVETRSAAPLLAEKKVLRPTRNAHHSYLAPQARAMAESFEVWDAWVRGLGGPGYYLILTQSSTFKYLEGPAVSPAALPDIHGRRLAFDQVPAGDWVIGRLSSHGSAGELVLQSTRRTGLADVGHSWSGSK